MPANLTPEYERAERRYRQATTDAEKLEALLEMLSALPKHKGTEKMQADLKRRISQLRKAQPKGSTSRGPDPFHIPKSGAGQVVLVGPPNTGKSSLLGATTHASARVADYPFTTLLPQPGMWEKNQIQIELVDTPPLTAAHLPPGLLSTIRGADIVCVVADASADALAQVESVLDLLQSKGLTLQSVPRPQLDPADPDRRPGLILVNKADRALPGSVEALRELYSGHLDVCALSAQSGAGLEAWFDQLWRLLAVIRVYTKQPGQPPDLRHPFTLLTGATIEDLARRIHRDLPQTMRHARIWGAGRHEGQQVHRTEPLHDHDIVEIHE